MKASSRWWYARFMVNGKLRRFPLMEKRGGKMERIEVKGIRPPSMVHPQKGDTKFLESYHRAKAAHDRLLEEELSSQHLEDLTQRIIEAKTGTRLDFVKLDGVPDAWAAIPRKRQPSSQYLETAKGTLRRFSTYIRKYYSAAEELAAVRAEHVRAFLKSEEARGISSRTWNITLKLLKTVFRRLEPNSDAYRSFLKDAREREEETVHREPFTEDEIAGILHAARDDDLMRPLIITALATAMRRGDCAQLKWESVDLAAGFIEVRTSKTGETAEIPILPALREELCQLTRTDNDYVFPAAADLYRNDRHALDRRLRAILARAGFIECARPANINCNRGDAKSALPKLEPEELYQRGLQAIHSSKMSRPRRERMKSVFAAYVSGKGLPTIARELQLSKSTVSLHLNELEQRLGVAVLRRAMGPELPTKARGAIHSSGGGQRLKRGSVRGWHSFRVSFVTRALSAGMPEELVRRVTGHSAVDVVRKHYFRPKREEFRREFEKAMPRLLMNGEMSREAKLRQILQDMTVKTFERDKARALALIADQA
jgi:integrase